MGRNADSCRRSLESDRTAAFIWSSQREEIADLLGVLYEIGGLKMAEYIDRAAAVKVILRERKPTNSVAQNRMLSIIQRDLLTMRAADVDPVVWIPVTERLPEDRSDVLVVAYWHERWGVYMGWCAPERAEWSVHIGIGDRNDVAVTHWMPLPEPPKGVTDNG